MVRRPPDVRSNRFGSRTLVTEDDAEIDVEEIEQRRSEQRPDDGAEVVAESLKSEGGAATRLLDRARDERIARRRADPGAGAIHEPSDEDLRPDGGKADERFGERRQRVAHERDGLIAAQPVRRPPGRALHDVLRRLGDAFDNADDARRTPELPRDEKREHRIEHLGRDVGEEAGEREQDDRPRKADRSRQRPRSFVGAPWS